MIINHKSGWIFILPPKTGSTSLYELLQSRPFGGRHHLNNDPRFINAHWPWPPLGTEGYKIFLSVRHPVARAMSQYRHYVRHHGHGHPAARSFAAWVERLAEPRQMPHRRWSFTCWRWLPDLVRPRLAGVVRCERMKEDLLALGIARSRFQVPHRNVGRGPRPELTEDIVRRLLDWGRDDLKRFGYGRPPDGGADDDPGPGPRSWRVRVHGPRVTAVQMRARCGGIKPDLAASRPQATPQNAAVLSDRRAPRAPPESG